MTDTVVAEACGLCNGEKPYIYVGDRSFTFKSEKDARVILKQWLRSLNPEYKRSCKARSLSFKDREVSFYITPGFEEPSVAFSIETKLGVQYYSFDTFERAKSFLKEVNEHMEYMEKKWEEENA